MGLNKLRCVLENGGPKHFALDVKMYPTIRFKNVNSPERSEGVYLFLAVQEFVPRDLTVTGSTTQLG